MPTPDDSDWQTVPPNWSGADETPTREALAETFGNAETAWYEARNAIDTNLFMTPPEIGVYISKFDSYVMVYWAAMDSNDYAAAKAAVYSMIDNTAEMKAWWTTYDPGTGGESSNLGTRADFRNAVDNAAEKAKQEAQKLGDKLTMPVKIAIGIAIAAGVFAVVYRVGK